MDEIDTLVEQITALCINISRFYLAFQNEVKELGQELEKRRKRFFRFLGK